MEKLKNFINQPYPFYYNKSKNFILFLAVITLASFTFSYFFEPFEVNTKEHKLDYLWICIIHSVSPFVFGILFFSIPSLFVKDETKWTILKEGIIISIFLFFTGIISFLWRDIIYDNPYNWSSRYFYEELRNTFLVGVLLLMIVLPMNLQRLIFKYSSKAKTINLPNIKNEDEVFVKLQIPLETGYFNMNLSNFIYAKVDGNYVDVHFKELDNSLERKIIRITLKDLEDQLKAYSFIFKTHRSYIVNTNYITSISGNAQGYILYLKDGEVIVPVSRSRIAKFDAFFNS